MSVPNELLDNLDNPFAYIKSEQDVLKFVNTLIANTKGEGAQSGEDFWVKAERLLFTAYVAYIIKYCKKEEQNFVSLLAMIDASETREEDESFENAIDLMFKDIELPDSCVVLIVERKCMCIGQAMAREYRNIHVPLIARCRLVHYAIPSIELTSRWCWS